MITTNSYADSGTIYLGMVEDVPGVYAGEAHSTKVRAIFFHQGNHWQAFQSDCQSTTCLSTVTRSFPKEVAWYVGLDGRQIGQVTARSPEDFKFYAHIGLQDITSGKIPLIGSPSWEFSGFLDDKVRRPLVAVSQPNFHDSQGWKRYKVTAEVVKQALQAMQSRAPAVCKESSSETGPLVPFHYGKNDLNIRAHKSSEGALLLTVGVKNSYYCNGGEGDGSYDSQTFAISPTGTVQYLGPGLVLVDAGDYAGDGSTQIVMSLSGYNKGGYVIFSSTFVEEARFQYIYH